MKKYLVMMAGILLFTSCTRESDYVVDLDRKTETVFLAEQKEISVIVNKNSMTFHLDPACSYLARMNEENRMELHVETTDMLLSHGYKACKKCAAESETASIPSKDSTP